MRITYPPEMLPPADGPAEVVVVDQSTGGHAVIYQSDREWNPIESAPKNGRGIEIELSNGRIVYAEYWEGPPGKEEEWGGWGICVTSSFCNGTLKDDCDATFVRWRECEQQRGPVDPPI